MKSFIICFYTSNVIFCNPNALCCYLPVIVPIFINLAASNSFNSLIFNPVANFLIISNVATILNWFLLNLFNVILFSISFWVYISLNCSSDNKFILVSFLYWSIISLNNFSVNLEYSVKFDEFCNDKNCNSCN